MCLCGEAGAWLRRFNRSTIYPYGAPIGTPLIHESALRRISAASGIHSCLQFINCAVQLLTLLKPKEVGWLDSCQRHICQNFLWTTLTNPE